MPGADRRYPEHQCDIELGLRRMCDRRPRPSPDGQDRRSRRMTPAARSKRNCARHRRGRHARRLGCNGSVAAEFALVAPLLVLIAAGIADFGMLATKSAGLTAATRIGAQYARVYPTDTIGIQSAIEGAMSAAP